MSGQKFIYGRCETDYKTPAPLAFVRDWFIDALQSNLFSKDDEDEQFFRETFRKLQLPLPSASQIFHGSDNILLFLDSHGVVLRIGRKEDTDPTRFLHPHILQPLGWVTSERYQSSVALYGAASLYAKGPDIIDGLKNKTAIALDDIALSLAKSNFCLEDISKDNNIGFIRLHDGTQFPVCIDISRRISERNNTQQSSYARYREENIPSYDALKSHFDLHAHSPYSQTQCREAFEFHQPLRHAFFSAWPAADKNHGIPDALKMQKFWQMAKNYVDNGYKIYKQDSSTGNRIITQTRHSPISWKKPRP